MSAKKRNEELRRFRRRKTLPLSYPSGLPWFLRVIWRIDSRSYHCVDQTCSSSRSPFAPVHKYVSTGPRLPRGGRESTILVFRLAYEGEGVKRDKTPTPVFSIDRSTLLFSLLSYSETCRHRHRLLSSCVTVLIEFSLILQTMRRERIDELNASSADVVEHFFLVDSKVWQCEKMFDAVLKEGSRTEQWEIEVWAHGESSSALKRRDCSRVEKHEEN